MTTFEQLADLPTDVVANLRRIQSINSAERTTDQAAVLANYALYLNNRITIKDADDNIVIAHGTTLPTGYSGFAKSALFLKTDAGNGTKGLYENVGTTSSATFNLIGDITSAEIGAGAVEESNIADGAVTSDKLASVIAMLGKTFSLPTETPVNALGSQGTLTISGDVLEGETITIGSRVYEIDSDGVVSGSNVAVDVSGGAVAATGVLTISGVVIDGETITIDGRVYEYDADSAITGDVAIDISAGTKTQATTTLTLTGVVKDGETFTIGTEVYEFDGGDGAVSGGNTLVDVSSFMVASQGTLTLGGAAPANDETMTVGAQVYTWKTTLTGAADEIKIGATIDDSIDNFVYAINAGIGAGTLYGTGTTANASVTAAKTSGTVATLTAKIAGTVGDAIATTETMVDAANVFNAATLGTTTAGVDGTVGVIWEMAMDTSYLYVATAANTIADANWRRISLGSAY